MGHKFAWHTCCNVVSSSITPTASVSHCLCFGILLFSHPVNADNYNCSDQTGMVHSTSWCIAYKYQHRHCLLQVAIVNHELRFTPMLQLAREHLQAGQIGQVRWVDIRLTLPAPSGGRKWDWWADEAQGGGVVGAFGSHVIDLLRRVFRLVALVDCSCIQLA